MYLFSYRIGDMHAISVNLFQSEMPKSERIWCVESTTGAIITRRDGKVCVVGNCLIQGIDEDVRCLIDAQPTRSLSRHVQKIGRGLRRADGKDICVILDHAGNSLALGLVTDIHIDRLDMHKPGEKGDTDKEAKVPKPKKCQVCHTLIPPGKSVCPKCGAIIKAISGVEAKDGELVLFSGGKQPKQPKPKKDEKQEFFSGLLGLAKERGYSEGWAAHAYRERWGVFPRGLNKAPVFPSRTVRKFDQMRRRQWHETQIIKAGVNSEQEA
jgi:superfamily II DNA or RNA helicase